jgi:hypothetical protein
MIMRLATSLLLGLTAVAIGSSALAQGTQPTPGEVAGINHNKLLIRQD